MICIKCQSLDVDYGYKQILDVVKNLDYFPSVLWLAMGDCNLKTYNDDHPGLGCRVYCERFGRGDHEKNILRGFQVPP